MELKATDHSYYCNDGNYFSNNSFQRYDTWGDFRDAWLSSDLYIDHDYNHCFRFDIKPLFNHELDEEYEDRFSLHLYFMLQRKGNFIPVEIKEIHEEDMEEITEYLENCWNYLKNQWVEFSKN